MKNKNIEIEYKNGVVENYVVVSNEDMKVPSMAFKTEAEAEFCVNLCKLLQASGKETTEALRLIPYMFRMAGIKSNWTD